MIKIGIFTMIGYLAGLVGFLGGALFSIATKKRGNRFFGTLMGFTAGLLISFVCFEMLPIALENSSFYFGVAGIVAGVCVCAVLEKSLTDFKEQLSSSVNAKYLKTGMLLGLGVMLHNIPEGMALGALTSINLTTGIKIAVIISIHCLAEAIGVFYPLIKSGLHVNRILSYSFVFSLPMAFGSLIGSTISNISTIVLAVSLSFAGGVMLYITCGQVIPESKDIWHGRLSTIGAMAGFVIGVLLTEKF